MESMDGLTVNSVSCTISDCQPADSPKVCSIQRLPKEVIDRIAAGEVIQRPVNAVKELLENCLDAGSTHIEITVRSGGLKLLQVQDNGSGIRVSDLPLLCERFTTSKLREFEDLSKLTTFGFRGEALASLSHVSLLTVTSRTAHEQCAYRVSYRNGKPTERAVACAGNQGTTILAEDLFYNTPLRRAALNNPREEFSRIAEVVSQYAVHYAPKCGFHLRSFTTGSNIAESALRTTAGWSRMDAVRAVIGSTVAQNMVSFDSSQSGITEATRFAVDRLGLRFEGLLTTPNQITSAVNPSLKLHLFINNRLVECTPIQRSLESSYSTALSRALTSNLAVRATNRHISGSARGGARTLQSGSILLVYLNLQLPPESLDVNVHPTKAEVRFLHEDKIIAGLQDAVDHCILSSSHSRSFLTLALSPPKLDTNQKRETPARTATYATSPSTFRPQEKVRIDIREQRLDRFALRSPTLPIESAKRSCALSLQSSENSNDSVIEGGDGPPVRQIVPFGSELTNQVPDSNAASRLTASPILKPCPNSASSKSHADFLQPSSTISHTAPPTNPIYPPKVKRRRFGLSSLLTMQRRITEKIDKRARTLLRSSKFVGLIDRTRCLVQHSTDLLLVRLYPISKALFYQLLVFNFGNHGEMVLSQPVPIVELLKLAHSPIQQDDESRLKALASEMLEHAAMLWDYFSIKIEPDQDTGGPVLSALPLLLDKYVPDMDYLPTLLSKLTTEVNWEEELPCFEDVCRILSEFYAVKPPMKSLSSNDIHQDVDADEELTASGDASRLPWRWTVEHIVWFAITKMLQPEQDLIYEAQPSAHLLNYTRTCSSSCAVLRLTGLTELYKVFERC